MTRGKAAASVETSQRGHLYGVLRTMLRDVVKPPCSSGIDSLWPAAPSSLLRPDDILGETAIVDIDRGKEHIVPHDGGEAVRRCAQRLRRGRCRGRRVSQVGDVVRRARTFTVHGASPQMFVHPGSRSG